MRENVSREVELAADADSVWAALTDPGRLSVWFGATATGIEPRPLARVMFVSPDGELRRAVVEEAEPRRRLVLRWVPDPGDDTAGGRVEFDIEPVGSRTRLTVTESRPSPAGTLAMEAS